MFARNCMSSGEVYSYNVEGLHGVLRAAFADIAFRLHCDDGRCPIEAISWTYSLGDATSWRSARDYVWWHKGVYYSLSLSLKRIYVLQLWRLTPFCRTTSYPPRLPVKLVLVWVLWASLERLKNACVTCVPGPSSRRLKPEASAAGARRINGCFRRWLFAGFRCIRCFLCWNARASDGVARVVVIQHMNWHWYECWRCKYIVQSINYFVKVLHDGWANECCGCKSCYVVTKDAIPPVRAGLWQERNWLKF